MHWGVVFTAGALLFLTCVQHDPFFWDTVQLASKQAHHFYNNGLNFLPLPEAIDSGHPPLLAYYLACIWSVFGKTLACSHWAMAPFLLANIALVYRLGYRLSHPRWAWALVPLVFFDPVVSGQHALVSPDVLVICGFLMAVEGVLNARNGWLALGVLLLCASSMRGMMTAAGLMCWCLALQYGGLGPVSAPLRRLASFVPGFALAACFLWWHQKTSGWVGFHGSSPWAQAFEPVGPTGFVKNLAIVGWRFLDFGRIVEWLILVALLWRGPFQYFWPHGRPRLESPASLLSRHLPSFNRPQPAVLATLFLCLAIFLLPSALRYQNLSAHRYFLPLFITLHLIVFQLLAAQKRSFWLGVVLVGLLSGHCWIYPRGISMDWDSTLAHRPYHGLRQEAVNWLDAQGIPFSTVGSAFPNLNTGENLLLNGDERQFSDKDFSKNTYIFVSNIFNDFSEPDFWVLEKEWHLLKRFEKSGVWIEIYGKP